MGMLDQAIIDGVPLLWIEPAYGCWPRTLTIWLPGFSGTKEGTQSQLQELAAAGVDSLKHFFGFVCEKS